MQGAPFLGGGGVHCSIDGGGGLLPGQWLAPCLGRVGVGWTMENVRQPLKYILAERNGTGTAARQQNDRASTPAFSGPELKEGHQKMTIIIGYFSQKKAQGRVTPIVSLFFIIWPKQRYFITDPFCQFIITSHKVAQIIDG